MTTTFLLHQLLRAAASDVPDGTAVKSKSGKLSYSELDQTTERLAATLKEVGLKKGDRVGIYVPKSLASIVSIYSILKAGGTYVPLDPDAPAERLAYISRDCGIRTLLTCSQKTKGVDDIVTKQSPIETVILVDCDGSSRGRGTWTPAIPHLKAIGWNEAVSETKPLPQEDSVETDTAYILYTSGSTGVPKGVMISHRNSLAFVEWAADLVGLNANDVVACHAPIHFDISTFSIYSACKAGASTWMVPDMASTFPIELSKLIESERVTVWYSVPSVLTFLVLYGNLQERELSRLRTIIFAGEVFPTKFLRQLISILPQARFLNWYGPTETNVCMSYEVKALSPDVAAPVPIGKACANTEVFALTSDGKVVKAPGESGELYARGPTVMQGYWNDPQKTAKVLVRNPLNPNFEEKVVRTGDIVTLDPDGNYLYLGRQDGMIKTRGYRVELGEIEAVLYSHPGISEAVVVPVRDELVGNRLFAFVSVHKNSTLTKEGIFAFCGSKLPKYMVPESITIKETLPKTSSGKMDRITLANSIVQGVRE